MKFCTNVLWWIFDTVMRKNIFGRHFFTRYYKKNTSKNTILFREFHNVCVKSNHTGVWPTKFKSFERAFIPNIAWASTQRRKCVFWGWKRGFLHFKMEPHSLFQSNPSTQEQFTHKIMMTERIKNSEHRIKISERFSHRARTKRSPNHGDWTAKHANRRK